MLVQNKKSCFASVVQLYASDPIFRSSLDFAAIGFAVYLFVAPLPSFTWAGLLGATSSNSTPQTAAPAAALAPPSDIARAANSSFGSPAKPAVKIDRKWFNLSDPSIVPALNRAVDELELRHGPNAVQILDGINRTDDPNVLNLRAVAFTIEGSKDSMAAALALFIQAGEAGHPDAMDAAGHFFRLGAAGRVDLAQAVDWYERGALAGSASAATNAGRAYVNGWERTVDHAKAIRYYRQAAEGGDDWGMHNLGAMLANGVGVEKNPQAGREWIEKSAKTGLPAAKLVLAEFNRKGIGGPIDVDAYLKWAEAAANDGLAPALYDLGMYFLEPGGGKQPDVIRAAGYLRQAALKKDAKAQFAYATLNERGVGVPANATQAFVYYSLALRSGEKAAEQRLSALRDHMSSQEIEAAQRLVAAST